MKKYLREIQLSSAILCIIGILMAWVINYEIAMWPCLVGIILFITVFVYKAFHWKEYEKDNKQGIIIILIATFFLIIQMLKK